MARPNLPCLFLIAFLKNKGKMYLEVVLDICVFFRHGTAWRGLNSNLKINKLTHSTPCDFPRQDRKVFTDNSWLMYIKEIAHDMSHF